MYIDWQLGDVCNFQCAYCNFQSRGGVAGWPEYEKATALVKNILAHSTHEYRTYNLLGGEPTLWKHFGELCAYIKQHDKNSVVQVLTNGSRSLRWWNTHAVDMDKVVISHHSHAADPEHTAAVVDICQPYNSVSVQILVDVHNFDQCQNHFYQIVSRCPGISVSVKKAETELGSGVWQSYSDNQLTIMGDMQRDAKLNNSLPARHARRSDRRQAYARVIYGSDGEMEWITSNKDLILSQQNKFSGWRCNIGIDMLCVKANGDLKPSSSCFKDEILGNYLQSDDIAWPQTAYTCVYSDCFCGADIEVEKHAEK
jgi:organic radical activating enzyme